ncbi:di-heme oxidoredictase family protein [Litorivita sp. NS0012-18]|uniref:di-heme oxidoreductase family protein n=1 Tax=Litorivita sp. NS0012-18 TaxID=3127655 RepID=UPI003106BA08
MTAPRQMPRRMRHALQATPALGLTLFSLGLAAFAGGKAFAQGAAQDHQQGHRLPPALYQAASGDPHLDAIPRTAAEAARIAKVTAWPEDFTKAQSFEQNPAGAATVRARKDADAFSQPSANMPFESEMRFKLGNGLFRKLWVASPASTLASDGLGPLYNARGCQRCHLKDGRGHVPEGPDDLATSMFLRIGVPLLADEAAADPQARAAAIEGYLATRGDATYGGQFQDFASTGLAGEGRMGITYSEETVALGGGETVSLRRPVYKVSDLRYGAMEPRAQISPRVAPQMIGLGLIEAIPAADILALADPDDADGDGISGRPNVVWSAQFDRPMLGRFGLKAGKPTVREQSAAAFAGDMGLSTSLHPDPWGDCTAAQAACRAAPHGDKDARVFEVDDAALDLVTFYSRNLAVPARVDAGDPQVLRGKKVFFEIGCASCHAPRFVTHRLRDQPEQSFQLIAPYSDFLLHDMGEGLADGLPEARAAGHEWRTAPLWGIGKTAQVSGHTQFLHDGRARSLLEAVVWHGGEAAPARDAVVALPPEARADLIRFLESL